MGGLVKFTSKALTTKTKGGKHKLVKNLPKKFKQNNLIDERQNLHLHERNKTLGPFDARPGTASFDRIVDLERIEHKSAGSMYSASDETIHLAHTKAPGDKVYTEVFKNKKGDIITGVSDPGYGMDMFGTKYGYPIDGTGKVLKHLGYASPKVSDIEMTKKLKNLRNRGLIP
tara:strand:+ start:214 stop:729 length:516 start_codon:yes stop_codon:yes gene_type:complete